jgi:hypothetical protein
MIYNLFYLRYFLCSRWTLAFLVVFDTIMLGVTFLGTPYIELNSNRLCA